MNLSFPASGDGDVNLSTPRLFTGVEKNNADRDDDAKAALRDALQKLNSAAQPEQRNVSLLGLGDRLSAGAAAILDAQYAIYHLSTYLLPCLFVMHSANRLYSAPLAGQATAMRLVVAPGAVSGGRRQSDAQHLAASLAEAEASLRTWANAATESLAGAAAALATASAEVGRAHDRIVRAQSSSAATAAAACTRTVMLQESLDARRGATRGVGPLAAGASEAQPGSSFAMPAEHSWARASTPQPASQSAADAISAARRAAAEAVARARASSEAADSPIERQAAAMEEEWRRGAAPSPDRPLRASPQPSPQRRWPAREAEGPQAPSAAAPPHAQRPLPPPAVAQPRREAPPGGRTRGPAPRAAHSFSSTVWGGESSRSELQGSPLSHGTGLLGTAEWVQALVQAEGQRRAVGSSYMNTSADEELLAELEAHLDAASDHLGASQGVADRRVWQPPVAAHTPAGAPLDVAVAVARRKGGGGWDLQRVELGDMGAAAAEPDQWSRLDLSAASVEALDLSASASESGGAAAVAVRMNELDLLLSRRREVKRRLTAVQNARSLHGTGLAGLSSTGAAAERVGLSPDWVR